uniref:Uncharacterized protein n=1 Tax=Acrobeloides nanus TaxID=290746 RepID=A0A914CLY1_9BILA
MNMQAMVFIIIFVVGLLMLVLSSQQSNIDEKDQTLSSTFLDVLRYLGIAIMAVGFLGMLFTFIQIIRRGYTTHRHVACQCHSSKWEQQVVHKHGSVIGAADGNVKIVRIDPTTLKV